MASLSAWEPGLQGWRGTWEAVCLHPLLLPLDVSGFSKVPALELPYPGGLNSWAMSQNEAFAFRLVSLEHSLTASGKTVRHKVCSDELLLSAFISSCVSPAPAQMAPTCPLLHTVKTVWVEKFVFWKVQYAEILAEGKLCHVRKASSFAMRESLWLEGR